MSDIYKSNGFFMHVVFKGRHYYMKYMIDMIDGEEQEHTEIDIPSLERAVRRVKAMMVNWGLGEGCSMIYAVLVVSHKPLSAEEIGKRTNYAYSSTINYLNTLIQMGLVERVRSLRKNFYVANVNFVALIKAELGKVKSYLSQLGSDLEGIKELEQLSEKVENAIAYLKRVEAADKHKWDG